MSDQRIKTIRIDRAEKNRMRKQLEEIIHRYQAITEQIETYKKETKAQEYLDYWILLQSRNRDNIEDIGRFAARKCNR
ncbi:MAG TPA: hypothetical protein GX404_06865 [Syntrophomonadaceae bacterium]|nr:hypothetical protein [Syntrophomonadaceae bacterium]